MTRQLVYSFADGDGHDKKLLGGKGANLCEMTQIGINVPPGFVITTAACLEYLEADALPEALMSQVSEEILRLQAATGKTFGAGDNPLLVSVRSGSALSMPGMMDTILNLGLNPTTLAGLIRRAASPPNRQGDPEPTSSGPGHPRPRSPGRSAGRQTGRR